MNITFNNLSSEFVLSGIEEQDAISDVRRMILGFTQKSIDQGDFVDLRVLAYFNDLWKLSSDTLQTSRILGDLFDILNCLEELVDNYEFIHKYATKESFNNDHLRLEPVLQRSSFLIKRVRNLIDSRTVPSFLTNTTLDLTCAGSSFLTEFQYSGWEKRGFFSTQWPKVFLNQVNIATENLIEMLWEDFKTSLDRADYPIMSHRRLREGFVALVKYYNSCRHFFDNIFLPYKTSYMHGFILDSRHIVFRVAPHDSVSCESCQYMISKSVNKKGVRFLRCENFKMPLCTNGIVISCDMFTSQSKVR